jgi:hypothetical protein
MATDIPADEFVVSVEGESVVIRPPAAACRLTPPAAEQLAQRLLDAADQARGGRDASGRPNPPFPPADLVSPHGAG